MNASFDQQVNAEINAKRVQEEDVDDSIIIINGSFTNMRPLDIATTPLRKCSAPTSMPSPTAETRGPACSLVLHSPAPSFAGVVTSTPRHPGIGGFAEDGQNVDDDDNEEPVGGLNILEHIRCLNQQKAEFKQVHKDFIKSVRSSMARKCHLLKKWHEERHSALSKTYRALQRQRAIITTAMAETMSQIKQSEGVMGDLEDMSAGISIPIPIDMEAYHIN